MKIIHAMLENGTALLFRPYEKVWTATWISDNGEYFDGDQHGYAKDLIVAGIYVIDRDGYGPCVPDWGISKIASVGKVDDNPSFLERAESSRTPCPQK